MGALPLSPRGRLTEDEMEIWLQSIPENNKARAALQRERPGSRTTTRWVTSTARQNQVVPRKPGPSKRKFVLSPTCLVAFARESA